MMLYDSLTHILLDARDQAREIRFIDGDKDESTLSFAELWKHAVDLLGALQNRGMMPGDELIIFTKSNRKFVVAFWASVLGGIVPVPVAVGISDEHRLKLFRILTQLQRCTLYTEPGLQQRLLEFAKSRGLSEVANKLEQQTVLDDDVGGEHAGEVAETSPEDTAFIQYSSGSTSDPKGVCLTHYNLTTNIRAIIEGTGTMPAMKSSSSPSPTASS